MFAVIKTGGKQYCVRQGDIVFIEKLSDENGAVYEDGSKVDFSDVIMVSGEDGVTVGAPSVDGASVSATVMKTGKSKKVTVFTYKSKKNEKRKMGHRQYYTKVQIDSITL